MTTTPTTGEILKFQDLQMAAEAFLISADGVQNYAGDKLAAALVRGNRRASKFTTTQADKFIKHWEVVEQKANTRTGFSGTLFKCILADPDTGAVKDEMVMRMRSTEFLDDAARDNLATNTMEIKKTGFAWGQIADMQGWYQEKRALISSAAKFSVTGYSLGGHLATVFNIMNPGKTEFAVQQFPPCMVSVQFHLNRSKAMRLIGMLD